MATRSFLVGDGNQVIRRENYVDSFSGITGSEEYRLYREGNKVKDKSVLFGVPSFSKIGSSNDAKKMKANAGNGRSMKLCPTSNVLSGRHIHTQRESIGSVSQLPGSCDQRGFFPFNCLSFIKGRVERPWDASKLETGECSSSKRHKGTSCLFQSFKCCRAENWLNLDSCVINCGEASNN
ncbi:uncharacterized protein LOC108327240 [Vigna angularis]|uniref:uncharacterized protein LOC108327240 n=1 Tax=Phaseolus angularis TaxID=3914 RepID=UPI0022B43CEC|nr:uncharacterized protein LOC108327240 [Vigna angularis]XP_052729446.1 uncharacterized protein LOC108327240 [Vigna angularis]